MSNVNRKDRHSYKVSYAHEVGSSFDPDMEDIHDWEQELAGALTALFHNRSFLTQTLELQTRTGRLVAHLP
jgi:hypothetical protein